MTAFTPGAERSPRNDFVFGAGSLHRIFSSAGRQRLLDQAFELGFRAFDAAPAYGNGLNELELGYAFGRRRSEVELTTKFGIPVELYGERMRAMFFLMRAKRKYLSRSYGSEYERRCFSASALLESLHGSLRRLRCDYVDRLMMHEPLEPLPSRISVELIDLAERLKVEGKIRSFGVCGTSRSIRNVLDSIPFDVVQAPIWDIADLPIEGAATVAYGAYREFSNRAPSRGRGFVDFVSSLRVERPRLEIILASTSCKTLNSWKGLFP